MIPESYIAVLDTNNDLDSVVQSSREKFLPKYRNNRQAK